MRYTLQLMVLGLMAMLSASVAAQSSPKTPTTPLPSSQAGSADAQQSQPGGMSVEDQLQLTPDQRQKISSVIADAQNRMGALRDDASMPMDQKQEKATQIRQEASARIRAVLTPEQLQKLVAIQQKQAQQEGVSPTAPTTPPAAPQARPH